MDKYTTYLTVAEYASLRGISKQRVYQLLNKDKGLKEFVKEIDGKKFIDIKALSDDELERFEQCLKQDSSKFDHAIEQELSISETDTSENAETTQHTELDLLKQSLDLLSKQLESKDKLIEDLKQSNEEKDQHIQEQAQELTRLLSQSQELQRNYQLLLAQAQKTALVQGQEAPEKQPNGQVDHPVEVQPEKQSFWKRWFG